MEFFRIVEVQTTESEIQAKLGLPQLEAYSNLLFNLGEPQENESAIGGLWGEFTLERHPIKGGLRFSLRECPNALAWTLTTGYPPKRDALLIHLTLNRERKAAEFIEEIEEFLEDHQEALFHYFN